MFFKQSLCLAYKFPISHSYPLDFTAFLFNSLFSLRFVFADRSDLEKCWCFGVYMTSIIKGRGPSFKMALARANILNFKINSYVNILF
jgi:hypothetical protein